MEVFTLTFVALLVIKLAEFAALSWWVVFSPLIAMVVFIFVIMMVIGASNG